MATKIYIVLAASTMAGVVNKFFITSLTMWAAPVAILYVFNHNLIPGKLTLFLFF
uniref:Uncharacterized protein n=1 Tax=Solanum lycopersicum TaxID=4081 RepID=K4D9H1_SOLLC